MADTVGAPRTRAEWQNLRRNLDTAVRGHGKLCTACRPRKPCTDLQLLCNQRDRVRDELATWDLPGEGQGELFGPRFCDGGEKRADPKSGIDYPTPARAG